MDFERLRSSVAKHEGCRLDPYRCTAGKLTIGYGRNLDDNGIRQCEAELMLDHDLNQVCDVVSRLPIYPDLTPLRQEVLIEMCFQLGLRGMLGFQKMFAALTRHDYNEAATQMLASRWAVQTPGRAAVMAARMVRG